jgi:FkbH-like protein
MPPTAIAASPTTLAEALKIVSGNPLASTADTCRVALVCGFTPLHLQTFFCAALRRRFPAHHIEISTGLYEDIAGTLRSSALDRFDAVTLVLEWADLDPRLGLRRCGGWSPRALPGVIDTARTQLAQLEHLITETTGRSPVVLGLPTLPLPPAFPTADWQTSTYESQLRASVASFAERVSSNPRVRLVSDQKLSAVSPVSGRLDVKSLWMFGFPYRTQHAACLAGLLAEAVQNRSPKKGLITDLDNTLWGGVVGDDGVGNLTWDLDHKTHAHALYQQLLSSLADEGVLVAVASKNDPALVDEAFTRRDLLLPKEQVFPIDVSWASKAQAVDRVLKAWNVHAESVMFIDDSAIELAEVKSAHPAIECVQFPSDPAAVYELLRRLRDEFGRATVTKEDEIRLASLRQQQAAIGPHGAADGYSETLLKELDAELSLAFSADAGNARALELVNKTNQFNLNGRRYTGRTWAEYLSDPAAFLLTAGYRDRFGALGTVAVVAGRADQRDVSVDVWVMSCRAFARRIEHQCLKALFDRSGADRVRLAYADTGRNGPFRLFLEGVQNGDGVHRVESDSTLNIARTDFEAACPRLYHNVLVTDGVENERCAHTSG